MKYKKIPIAGYKQLNMYPVYLEKVYDGKEPFRVVGIRVKEVELEGDFSGGTHPVSQKEWFPDNEVFAVSSVCPEELKEKGCQIHNIYCCGGGNIITEHIQYWESLITQ